MYKTKKRNTRSRRKYTSIRKKRSKKRTLKKLKGGYRVCDEHKIFVRNADGSVNKENSLKGTIHKFNCYQTILNDPSQKDKHSDVRRQYDDLIQLLINSFYSKKDIFLKHLIKDERYKSLSDDELKTLLTPLTRMQEDAIPPSMPIIDYILRERNISTV
jgi:hypothetical protein